MDVSISRHEYGRMFEVEETNRRCCDAAFSLVSMMILAFRVAGCAVRQQFLVFQRHVVEYLTEALLEVCLMVVALLRPLLR